MQWYGIVWGSTFGTGIPDIHGQLVQRQVRPSLFPSEQILYSQVRSVPVRGNNIGCVHPFALFRRKSATTIRTRAPARFNSKGCFSVKVHFHCRVLWCEMTCRGEASILSGVQRRILIGLLRQKCFNLRCVKWISVDFQLHSWMLTLGVIRHGWGWKWLAHVKHSNFIESGEVWVSEVTD